MLINTIKETGWRKSMLLLSIAFMLGGFLFSRSLLSTGMIGFVIFSLLVKDVASHLKSFFSSPFLLFTSFLSFIPLITGIWSGDVQKWVQVMMIKLPLLVFPICFTCVNFSFKEWRWVARLFVGLVMASAAWSFILYAEDVHAVHAGYLRAHVIQTPMGGDHVRFSLVIALAIITAVFLFDKAKKTTVVVLSLVLAILIIYLHILAVRTGLLAFYVCGFIFIIWLLVRQKGAKNIIWVLILLSLPVASYFIFPTFKNRVSYFRYDFSFIKKDVYLPGSNDGTRWISLHAGWELQNKHPLTGVGFGDLRNETNRWYAGNYPQINANDRILPSSEWLIHGAGAGWPGFILFSFVMLVPFFIKKLRSDISWWLINISFLLSYLFDIGLEVQYGVFLHAFFLLWWYKWLQSKQ